MKYPHLYILVSILLATPTHAVDYVQCREMLRTRNEMIHRSSIAEHEYKLLYQSTLSVPESECPKSWDPIIRRYISTDQSVLCEINYKNKMQSSISPVVKLPDGTKFYTQKGYSWYKSAGKVESDMKKSSCPDL